ncbi:MAG: cysteine--tRNA ligase, partial [Rhodobacteraceae bacterium]|nr:cysteine--tRNA ligase [Paracoccaceae bacterium]
KSLGNFFTVRDLLDQGIPGEVIRFVFLSTHYRKPMDWTAKKAEEAEKTLRKWYDQAASGGEPGHIDEAVVEALARDLNTAGALSECHRLSHADDAVALRASLQFLGLMGPERPDWAKAPSVDLSRWAERLSAMRIAAMESKDFSAVDRLKAALIEAGIEVRMSKSGVELTPQPDFDPAKLEALA